MSRLKPYLLSIALHALIVAAIVFFGVREWRDKEETAPVLVLEGRLVTTEEIAAQMPATEVAPPREAEPVATPPLEPTPLVDEAKQQREAEAKRERESSLREAARMVKEQRLAEQKRVAEQQRLAEQKRVAEQQRQADLQKLIDEQEQAERRRALAAQAEKESDLQRRLAAEQAAERRRAEAARRASLSAQWAAAIQARVQRAWLRPGTARAGIDCRVAVTQVQGGTVVRVEVRECNGDEAVRQSIEAAVFRASPLPPPPEPELFERNLELRFRPND
jgi:colicin import membrane protein